MKALLLSGKKGEEAGGYEREEQGIREGERGGREGGERIERKNGGLPQSNLSNSFLHPILSIPRLSTLPNVLPLYVTFSS